MDYIPHNGADIAPERLYEIGKEETIESGDTSGDSP